MRFFYTFNCFQQIKKKTFSCAFVIVFVFSGYPFLWWTQNNTTAIPKRKNQRKLYLFFHFGYYYFAYAILWIILRYVHCLLLHTSYNAKKKKIRGKFCAPTKIKLSFYKRKQKFFFRTNRKKGEKFFDDAVESTLIYLY